MPREEWEKKGSQRDNIWQDAADHYEDLCSSSECNGKSLRNLV